MNTTFYSNSCEQYGYKVTFIVNKTKEKLTRVFTNEYDAYRFVNKLKHSKRCSLVSYPSFS